jgi:hypothetical protein
MKIEKESYYFPIILGITWSLVLFNYALSSKTTFFIYSIALLITGFIVGSDLVFYHWAKEKKDEKLCQNGKDISISGGNDV